MGVTKTYNRPKSTPTNSTGIAFTILAEEKPETPATFAGAGNTGNLDCYIKADADESGGADVQNIFRIESAIAVESSLGTITLTITVSPVNGDGTSGTSQTLTVTHGQAMDVWQTAAGRARQA